MKKLVTLSFALLFLFNLAGYYIAYPVMSWCIKSTVRAGMEAGLLEKKLVLVKVPVSLTNLPNNEFQLTDENEFQYMGRMYDVSSKEVKGDFIYYYCYSDNDEDQLVASLNDHVNSDSAINATDHKSGSHLTVIKSLKEYLKTFCLPQDIVLSGHFSIWNRNVLHLNILTQDVHSPPPKS